jgi:hypothetical protein
MMMKLFGKWKKSGPEIFSHNNKSIFGSKRPLFDDIYGFDDVKGLFKMAIHHQHPPNHCLCVHLQDLKGHITQLEVVPQNLESLTICSNRVQ